MIRMCHYVTLCCLLLSMTKALAGAAESDLAQIEHQILITRSQLTQASLELRDAKTLAAEKLMEYEISKDAFQQTQDDVTANSFDHAQQRLSLAEMGVEAKTARFARLQRRLEEFALAHKEAISQKEITNTKNSAPPSRTTSLRHNHSNRNLSANQHRPMPADNKSSVVHEPVLSVHGKISDAHQLNTELQNLEHHLVAPPTSFVEPIRVKAYGTAIVGEIALSDMGGNQFFAKFPAPQGSANIIIGTRYGADYLRTELHVTFAPEEVGKDFVLIFDINTRAQPRALVFQESLAVTQEMFASHSGF